MSARILWAIIVGFFLGVFVRSIFNISPIIAFSLVLLGIFAFGIMFLDRSKKNILILCAIVCIAYGAGIWRMDIARLHSDPVLDAQVGTAITIRGFVVEEPDVRERSVRLTVDVFTIIYDSKQTPAQSRILVIAPPYLEVAYGDEIIAKGGLQLPEAFATDEGRTFDYRMYLAKDGILYTLAFAHVEKTGNTRRNPAKAFAIATKQLFLQGLRASIPEPESALAGGITVGDKRSIGEELTDVFQRSSLVHVVVLSGYNITVVLNAAAKAVVWTPYSMRLGTSGLIISFFILMTGGAATAVRAGLMALLAVYARTTGRIFIAARVLGVVCVVMVLWNPYTLLFDPSFQLSALATLGLILFTPWIAERLGWIPSAWQLREIAASTLATQLTVLPLLLFQNGTLSVVALPANLLALIVIPLAMGLSAVAALFGLIAGPLAPILSFPAYIVLAYIIAVAQFFASLPFAAFTVPAFSTLWLALSYIALGVLWWMWLRKIETQNSPIHMDRGVEE